jgi:1,4-alpha-glucan branching enzyme
MTLFQVWAPNAARVRVVTGAAASGGAHSCGAELGGASSCGAELGGASSCGAELGGVELGGTEMQAEEMGWWLLDVPDAGPGVDYAYRLDDERPLPDPRSQWQPTGVHGPSRVYDHAAFAWTDRQWTGRWLPGSVLYELHIGTFTPEGTFDAAIARLDHLVNLGVDLVELLPVNAFNGEHNWAMTGCAGTPRTRRTAARTG